MYGAPPMYAKIEGLSNVRSITIMYTKIVYDLTVVIINKCDGQNDWLKIICIRYNSTQFCSHCVNEIKNVERQRNFLNNMHQTVISTKLCRGATEYKVSSISAHSFLSYNVCKILEIYIQTVSKNGQIMFRTPQNM